jgi:hypothetical protein
MATANDRSVLRLEGQLQGARNRLAEAEKAREPLESGSAEYMSRSRIVDRTWMRVRRLERELEAVRLARAGR